MFSKGSKTPSRDHRVEPGHRAVPSIISADLTVKGDMTSAGEIQVDGVVEGDIQCKALVIGVDGAITGEIDAESVRLHGKVTGQIRAKTVFLASTARMVGDITHESLAIEPGAFMEGHCRRMTANAASANQAMELVLTGDGRDAGETEGDSNLQDGPDERADVSKKDSKAAAVL